MREVITSRVDRFLVAVRDNAGPGIAKTCRTVVSGILGYAQRNDAVTHNAARGVTPLSGKPRRQPRALTDDERAQFLGQLAADETAVEKDLPDLVEFMLSSGCRIGEALAVSWDEVDLDAASVKVAYTLIRVKGQGLIRKTTKTEAGRRTLPLPASTVEMLRRRRSRSRTFFRGLVRRGGERSDEVVTSANAPEPDPERLFSPLSLFSPYPLYTCVRRLLRGLAGPGEHPEGSPQRPGDRGPVVAHFAHPP